MMKRYSFGAALLLALSLAFGWSSQEAQAKKARVYTGLVAGVAVGGYDPVAYFKMKKAVRGKSSLSLTHAGAKWRFSSEANKKAFAANPGKYAPKYGGYCAYAVSQGYTAKGDPHAWSIVGGRLYLNYSKSVRALWNTRQAHFIKTGNKNWPKVLN